jgi:outer membrane protein assembly factor BamB
MRFRAPAAMLAASLLGGFALVAAAGGIANAAPASSPWAQTSYNAAQSRANLGEKTLTAGTEHRIRFQRNIVAPSNVLDGCDSDLFSAPVLTGGRLFTMASGDLTSYSAATGHRLWRDSPLPAISGDASTVAVSGGLVIVAGEDCGSVSDPNGNLAAFRASTGKPVWATAISPIGGALSQMVVTGPYVVATGFSPGSGTVVAVHKVSTGALVWDAFPNNCNTSPTVLVVHGLVIYGGCGPDNSPALVADHLATGTQAWIRAGAWTPDRGDRAGSAGQNLYTENPAGQVVDLRPQSGRVRLTLAGATSVLAVDSSRVYGICGGTSVCAYRISTGARLWSFADSPSSAAEAGGVLYLSDGQALSASTGTRLRRIFHHPSQASDLVVGDGQIAVANAARTLDFYGLPRS